MAGRKEFDSGKFKELVLLFAERSAQDPLMSRVKLNKLLYWSDFEAFRQLGASITGATYIKGEYGPMAAELPLAEDELASRGYLHYETRSVGPHAQKVPIADEKADEAQFGMRELEIVDAALALLRWHGGKGASDWSHQQSAGWRVKELNEPIPYETAIVLLEPAPDDVLDEIIRRERLSA